MSQVAQQTEQMRSGKGFIAALDQSGGSTPKALKLYGIEEDRYSGEADYWSHGGVLNLSSGFAQDNTTLAVSIFGANGLMDKLVVMGLLPQEQAMGARMMLGLFAKPGDGPDSLVSKIEVDGATGGISANGQQLQ